MPESEQWVIDSNRVIHENLDGEQVLIDLVNGNYFSFSKVAVDIWNLLEKNIDTANIIKWITGRYSGEKKAVEKGVIKFLEELHQEHIINKISSGPCSSDLHLPDYPEQSIEFELPVLNKYTDMNELLLIDPIHDVSETGWPNQEKQE